MLKSGVLGLFALLAVSAVNCEEYSLKGINALVSTYHEAGARNIVIDGPGDLAAAYEIYISDPKLTKLGKGSFVNMPRLDTLTITNGQLQELEPESFQNLPVLRNLNLSGNRIEAIPDGIFNGLDARLINLTDNRISKMYGEAFDDLPSLRVVSLSHNKLKAYNKQWFRSCPKLYRIIMHNNLIEELPSNMLQNLKGREGVELWFMYNKIKTIDPTALAGVKTIRDLWLGYNEIGDLREDVFRGVQIQTLEMDNNQLKCVSEKVLRGMAAKEVDIDWNPLDCQCLAQIRALSKTLESDVKTTGRALECMKERIGTLLAGKDNLGSNNKKE